MRQVIIDAGFGRPDGDNFAATAIRRAIAYSDRLSSGVGFARLKGRTVRHVAYSDAAFGGQLSAGLHLAVRADLKNLFGPTVDILNHNAQQDLDSAPDKIELIMGDYSWQWDRAELAASLAGRTVLKAFHNGHEFYLYLSGDLVVAFSTVRTLPHGWPLLHWRVSD